MSPHLPVRKTWLSTRPNGSDRTTCPAPPCRPATCFYKEAETRNSRANATQASPGHLSGAGSLCRPPAQSLRLLVQLHSPSLQHQLQRNIVSVGSGPASGDFVARDMTLYYPKANPQNMLNVSRTNSPPKMAACSFLATDTFCAPVSAACLAAKV